MPIWRCSKNWIIVPTGSPRRLPWGFQSCTTDFKRALGRVWDGVRRCLTSQPLAEICFAGHSLGAALAVLASSRFADGNMPLYTYGCPRVGNPEFCDRVLADLRKKTFQFVNLNDSVAHVPTTAPRSSCSANFHKLRRSAYNLSTAALAVPGVDPR